MKAGIITEDQIQRAMEYESGSSLVERLLSLGYGSEQDVYKIIKNKLKLAVAEPVEISNIPEEVLSSVPKELIEKHHFLPFYSDATSIHIAMFDPTADPCINEICFFTSQRVLPYGVLASELCKAMNKYFKLGLPETFKYGTENLSDSKMSPPPIKGSKPEVPQKKMDLPPIPNIPIPNAAPKTETPAQPAEVKPASNDPKDILINTTLDDMKKLSKRCIILFRKYDDLICDAGFGDKIDDNLKGYTVPLNAPSLFMGVYESKKPFHGFPVRHYLTDEFLKALGGIKPKVLSVVPAIIEDEIFAMLYAEDVSDLEAVKKVTEKMAKEFEKMLES